MQFMKNGVRALISLTRLNRGFNSRPAYNLFFIYFMLIKLETLLKMQFKLQCIPDDIFTFLIMKHRKCSELSVDDNLYVLCNPNSFKDSKNKWFYLLCKGTKRKYKIAMIFTNEVPKNTIFVSESMKLNVNNRLSLRPSDDTIYFLLSVPDNSANYATEVKISLISNPYDCTEELMTSSLKNFFTNPKYIRLHDIFSINIKKYVPESVYCASNDLKLKTLHFKVSNIKTENDVMNRDGCFAVYGKTTLIQETNINSYILQKCFCDISFDLETQFCSSWPPALKKPLEHLQSCIAPFIQKDVYLNLKPVFLVEGPNGSGKSRLVKLSAEMLGLHLLEADFTEVQSLTSAQTEAKLRIIFSDAENCVPCILMLKNIQIFGINSEGQKDERVLSAFSAEIKKLYSKKLKYPIIIMAISNDSEIPIDPEKTFLEKIKMNYLENNQRTEMISWIIKRKGLRHRADLEKIAKICSDFVLVDLDGLVSHAIKIRFKLMKSSQQNFMELQHDDFIHACEYMQSMFSDQIGAPRVPKVYWEDIGGLADLKHEIINRIEILNVKGMNRSGLLLYGPPGTGKTLLAKAVATECRLHFLSVKGPELLNMYVGQSEKNVRQVFERARAAAPCIIFFDELDSLAPNRGRSGDSGGVMDRVVSQLLAEMDGLESSGNIFIIAATNRPDLIDPALLRPGRFDKMLYVGIYNDRDSQLSVLKAVTRKFRLEKDGKELEQLVDRLPTNLTGADLHSVCSNAWLGAVRRILTGVGVKKENVVAEDIIVKLEDFIKACKNLVPSVSKDEMARYEKLKNELSSR